MTKQCSGTCPCTKPEGLARQVEYQRIIESFDVLNIPPAM